MFRSNLKATGILKSDHYELNASVLVSFDEELIIEIDIGFEDYPRCLKKDFIASFKGLTEDNQVLEIYDVICIFDYLRFGLRDIHFLNCCINGDLILGERTECKDIFEARYVLEGLDGLTFTFNRLPVNIAPDQEISISIEAISESSDIPIENAPILELNGQFRLSEVNRIAFDIVTLLSLALGKSVRFDKCDYRYLDGSGFKVFRKMKEGPKGISGIVPSTELGYLMRTGLSKFYVMDSVLRKKLRATIVRLAYSNYGYMEDRILLLLTCLDMLTEDAKYKSREINEDEHVIKQKLLSVIRNDCPESYCKKKREVVSSKIGSLFQPTFKEKLDRLCELHSIIPENLAVNLSDIVNVRNELVHRLFLPFEDKAKSSELLVSLQWLLRVIVLKELGYEGHIYGIDNGCQKRMLIESVTVSF